MSWDALEMRHLKAFRAVAQTRSFARAALELGYTQSAISMQIASLEKVVGARVFERGSGRREVRVTRAGEALLEHVDALLQGAGVAIMPWLAVERADPSVRLLDMEGLLQPRIVALAWARDRLSPAGKIMVDAVLDACQVIEREGWTRRPQGPAHATPA